MYTQYLLEGLKGRENLEELGLRWENKILLKLILRKQPGRMWTGLTQNKD
jgi:hypothetical protein